MSLQVVSTVRRDNVQFFTKRRFSALFWLTRTSPGANFHIGGRLCMQLFTYEIMSEIIGLTHANDCEKTWKNVPLRNFLTYMDVSACKFSHERTCLYTTCPIISYVWARPRCFHAVCRLQACSCACSHTKRPVSAHFLSYEVISMHNVKHMTQCWSPNFP